MIDLATGSWRGIAEKATAPEMDPTKFMALIEELCLEMDKEDRVVLGTAICRG